MAEVQHLIELRASNFKRLRAVRIAPADPTRPSGVMQITGENGAGKSSVLDAIAAALLGKKYIPEEPVRRGEDRAEVILETEELTITRTFTAAGGGTLKVQDKEGRTFSSPQALLDTLCCTTGFDPLSFARMDNKKQTAMLLEICPVEIDLEANAAEQKTIYDERANLNRDLKREQAMLNSWTPPDVEVPEAEVVVSELIVELEALKDKQAKQAQVGVDLSTASYNVKKYEKLLESARADYETAKTAFAALEDPGAAIGAVRVRIDNAETANVLFRNWQTRRKTSAKVADLTADIDKLTTRLLTSRRVRFDALKAADFRVEGLSLNEDGDVVFKDLPFSQAATSEQIQVGLELVVAAKPTLRLVFVRDGDKLDHKNKVLLAELAEKHDLEVLIEVVDDKSPAAIEIVDGSTKPGPAGE